MAIDASLLAAAVRSSTGASNRLLIELDRGKAKLVASVPLWLEYEAVLKRAEQRLAHGLSLAQIDALLEALALVCEPTTPTYVRRPSLADPCDEMILEAALSGGAKAIVTHKSKNFEPARRFAVQVWKPARALKELLK